MLWQITLGVLVVVPTGTGLSWLAPAGADDDMLPPTGFRAVAREGSSTPKADSRPRARG